MFTAPLKPCLCETITKLPSLHLSSPLAECWVQMPIANRCGLVYNQNEVAKTSAIPKTFAPAGTTFTYFAIPERRR